MKVTVFGANGKVGRLIVKELLSNGYEVVAFVHRSSLFEEQKTLKIVQGDIHTLSDVKLAVKNSEVILSALGSWGTKQKDILSVGTRNIIEALNSTNRKRVITLTGADALAEGEKVSLVNKLLHSLIKLTPARRILNDGERHIRLLQESDLNWTIVRSPVMNNKGNAASYVLSGTKPKLLATVNRKSVADAMVKLINANNASNKALFISRS